MPWVSFVFHVRLFPIGSLSLSTPDPARAPRGRQPAAQVVVSSSSLRQVTVDQIINVYNQEYESGAAFWPDVHGRVVCAMIISQLLLLGLLSTKEAANSTPMLLALPILTIWFHRFCKNRYEPVFVHYPLQEAMMKDTLERTKEPHLNLKSYLLNAYIHPIFKDEDEDSLSVSGDFEPETVLVPTKRQSRKNTPVPSKYSGSSSPSLAPEVIIHEQP